MEFLQYVNNGWAFGIAALFILYLTLKKTKVLDLLATRKKDDGALVEHLKIEHDKKDKLIKELQERLEKNLFEKTPRSRGSKKPK